MNYYYDLPRLYSFTSFEVYVSIKNEVMIILSTKENNSLISFNLEKKYYNTVVKAHDLKIEQIKHLYTAENNNDIIISADENIVKIWEPLNWMCLAKIQKEYRIHLSNIFQEQKHTIATLRDNNLNKDLIIIPHQKYEGINVFDIKGIYINTIKNKGETYFIDCIYDNKKNLNYIIKGSKGYCESFIFEKNSLYKSYKLKKSNLPCFALYVSFCNNLTKLITNDNKAIFIFDFHSSKLLNEIRVSEKIINIYLLNEKYLFYFFYSYLNDNNIKLINIDNGKIEKSFKSSCYYNITSIKKFYHNNLGECLVSKILTNSIFIWKIEE